MGAAAAPQLQANQPQPTYSQTGERVRRSMTRDSELAAYEDQVNHDIKGLLQKDLENYCLSYCNIMSVDAIAEEVFDASSADLGFEGANTAGPAVRKFRTLSVNAEILVDTRFGTENIDRVAKLFEKLTTRYGKPIGLSWSRVTFPETAATQKNEAQVRAEFASQVRNRIERLIAEFCPSECKLNALDVNVTRATMDEAERGSVQRFLFANDGRGALFVNGVQLGVSIHSGMSSVRRSQIVSLIRESLLPFGSVSMDVDSVAFPTPASELQKDKDDERRDPYNIEKVGALLRLFRENLVSKEVIKETNNSTSSQERESRERAESRENNSALQREKEMGSSLHERESRTREGTEREINTETNHELGDDEGSLGTWLAVGAGFVLLVLLGAIFWLRRTLASPQMREALDEGTRMRESDMMPADKEGTVDSNGSPDDESSDGKLIRSRLDCDALQQEIRQIFVQQPKVARDVFTRILQENGVESTAKYVVIFGEIVIYELLCDSDLKDDLNALAEVVHTNAPTVADSERYELLRQLKMKLTAGKMRLLTNKTLDAFDFLKAWAPRQLFELVQNENSQIQGIVLTQLPPEKRRAVFEHFPDNYKTILLQELSRIDLAPREYLIATAETLRAKAQRNPIFDAENVRGADVLLELLTGATHPQQLALINQLDASNPEAAWRVRNSLVTADTVVGMPNGLLIEMFLDFDPQEIGLFLAKTRPNVRDIILSRTPREIASNWADFMGSIDEVDGVSFAGVEQKVLSKIRQYAAKGKISLAEINARLYPRGGSVSEALGQDRATRIQEPGAVEFSLPGNNGKPNRVA
jgi:flagellar motor switch protein FliG